VILAQGDAGEVLRSLGAESVQCCVTSPPYYGQRDYGVEGQMGLEDSPFDYVDRLVGLFREVRRVLAPDGLLWLNLGDAYASNASRPRDEKVLFDFHRGSDTPSLENERHGRVAFRGGGIKGKDLIGLPWMVAFALRADGWWLRRDIVWNKLNCKPESVRDRPTTSHEYLFMLSKSPRYYYDRAAIAEPAGAKRKSGNVKRRFSQNRTPGGMGHSIPWEGTTRNKRSVWSLPSAHGNGAHYATFPVALVEPCILAGSRLGDAILDPFVGTGTTLVAAAAHGRAGIGIDINAGYLGLAASRIRLASPATPVEFISCLAS